MQSSQKNKNLNVKIKFHFQQILINPMKVDFSFLEVYLHTSEIRGREDFFAKDYEIPIDPKALSIDTGKLTIKESADEILNVYRKMATVA